MVNLKKDNASFSMNDIRQEKKYALYLSEIGWKIKKERGTYFFTRNILPFLEIVKIQRPETLDSNLIAKIKKENRIVIIIVEPKDKKQTKIIKKEKFKQIKPYLPSKTLALDLSCSLKEILKKTKKDCRLAIRKTKNIKIKKCKEKELSKFHHLWKTSVGIKRYVPSLDQLNHLAQSFKKDSLFLLYQDKENAYSGAIFLRNKQKAYYWQAFTNKKARKKLVQYQIVWRGIKWAKKNKCFWFDFEGVFDPRFPNEKWLGFSHFKKSFGGKEIIYPGTFAKINLNFR